MARRRRGDAGPRDAAEAAIASPLLEDINLTGAKGVLVNITAGMNISNNIYYAGNYTIADNLINGTATAGTAGVFVDYAYF